MSIRDLEYILDHEPDECKVAEALNKYLKSIGI